MPHGLIDPRSSFGDGNSLVHIRKVALIVTNSDLPEENTEHEKTLNKR